MQFYHKGIPMSLNIKNDEAHQLARELAQLTGETMTGAVTVALRERLARERRERSIEDRVRELHAIGQRCAQLVSEGPPSTAHGDVLYGEDGLPK